MSSPIHGVETAPRSNIIEVHPKTSPAQKSFWQAITVGDLDAVRCLLHHRNIEVNQYDDDGEQRQGGTALHLAILEMPTWKGSEGRNGIQTADFVKSFIICLLDSGADIESVCRYKGEWYLQTAAGKTKSFFPEGYDSLGLVLQFIEITRGAEVIANDVTKRLELIRDLLLEHIQNLELKQRLSIPAEYTPRLTGSLFSILQEEKYTDVDIHCENKVFKAHRAILAARSVVFDAMFSSSLQEGNSQAVVKIEQVEASSMSSFLHFLYTDTIPPEFQQTCDLLALANRYDVHDLKEVCTRYLANNLDVNNAACLLSIADAAQAVALKQYVLHFISNNIPAVREASDDYSNLDANLMREILDSFIKEPSGKRFRTGVSSFAHHSPTETRTARDDTIDAATCTGAGIQSSDKSSQNESTMYRIPNFVQLPPNQRNPNKRERQEEI